MKRLIKKHWKEANATAPFWWTMTIAVQTQRMTHEQAAIETVLKQLYRRKTYKKTKTTSAR